MPPSDVLTYVKHGWAHLQRGCPLAAWASWQQALRIDPEDKPALLALERLANAAELPAAARAVYRFQTPADATKRTQWDRHLRAGEGLDDLEVAASAFRAIVADDPSDHTAWINLALCLAWLARNAEAIAALEQVVVLQAEADPEKASDAWLLAEVLRLGAGAEALADDLRYSWTLDWNGPPAGLIDHWPNLHALPVPIDPVTGLQALDQGQVFAWLDRPPPEPDAPLPAHPEDLPRRLAAVIVTPRLLRLSSPDPTAFAALDDDPRFAFIANLLATARREKTPLGLADADAVLGTFQIPEPLAPEDRAALSRSILEYYYEDLWIHVPRIGLDNNSPRDAARGDAIARAKLAGVVRFREQLGARPGVTAIYQGYPFDRLRRRLGLVDPADCAATLDLADVTCMSERELTTLDLAPLDPARLAEAFRSAAAFRDDALTLRFASAILDRDPPALAGVDPIALFAPKVRAAMSANDPEAALTSLERAIGLIDDIPAQRTFATWSAEILSRTGAPDSAADTFRRLVAQAEPSRAAAVALDAAETLLDNGHTALATEFLLEARDRAYDSGDQATLARAEALLGSH